MIDETHHNSHIAVIRKRCRKHPSRPFDSHSVEHRAMADTASAVKRGVKLLRELRRSEEVMEEASRDDVREARSAPSQQHD